MIFKNTTIGKAKNVTIAEFGKGDILMGNGRYADGQGFVVLSNSDKPYPIGTEIVNPHKTLDAMDPEILLVFSKPESIDVMVEKLNACKQGLLNRLNLNTEQLNTEKKYCDIVNGKAMGGKIEFLIGDSWYILSEIVGKLRDLPITDSRIRKVNYIQKEKICKITNEKFSYVIEVDGKSFPFTGGDFAEHLEQHYKKLGYTIIKIDENEKENL